MEEMKWVYELIVEYTPPFSRLPRRTNILVQLLFLEFVGVMLSIYFNLPRKTILAGSFVILVVVLWSLITLEIAPTIRKFKPSFSVKEYDLIEKYKKTLFSKKQLDLIPGFLIFGFLSLYFFYNSELFVFWIGSEFQFVLYLFFFLLLWDICYRMGLGLWIGVLSLWRSHELKKLSLKRKRLEYTPLRELNYFHSIDSRNVYFGILGFSLVPILLKDSNLVVLLTLYSTIVIFLSLYSKKILSSIPFLPPDILGLCEKGRFSYVGTLGEYPHVTPVVFVFDGNGIFFVTSIVSKKLKNLKENKNIAFLIDYRDPHDIFKNKAVLFFGKAKIYGIFDTILKFPKVYRIRKLFFEKYPKYTKKYKTEGYKLPKAWQMTPIVARILIEVKPEKMIYWRKAKPIRLPI